MSITKKEVETMKTRIREHIRNNKIENRSYVAKPIICTDGFNVSVQASKHHYCSPREYDAEWASVELSFPLRLMILSKSMQRLLTSLHKRYMAMCRLILRRVSLSSTGDLRSNDSHIRSVVGLLLPS